jgi:hypothetical protein
VNGLTAARTYTIRIDAAPAITPEPWLLPVTVGDFANLSIRGSQPCSPTGGRRPAPRGSATGAGIAQPGHQPDGAEEKRDRPDVHVDGEQHVLMARTLAADIPPPSLPPVRS